MSNPTNEPSREPICEPTNDRKKSEPIVSYSQIKRDKSTPTYVPYQDREPQHKTPQHTTTKMSGRRPPSGGFAPLSPWAGEICPQIIVPLFPYECAQAANRRSCARRRRFLCLGRQNGTHRK